MIVTKIYIALFFLGMDRDDSVRILDGCGFHTIIGMQNLIDRSLLTISDLNKLEMHQLLRDMGRNIRNHWILENVVDFKCISLIN